MKPTPPSVLKRDATLDAVISQLRNWSEPLLRSEAIAGAWLFGSAVNESGLRFQAGLSDVDLIVLVRWDALSPTERIDAMAQLKRSKFQLEQVLLHTLGRESASERIVSLVPMTPWEIQHGIHKDGNDAILRSVLMLDLGSGTLQASLAQATATSTLPTIHQQTAQFIQKQRATYLSVSANGKSAFHIREHSDPVPKELMRHFAIATVDLDSGQDHADLTRGLNELSLTLADHRNGPDEDLMTRYARWLEVQRGARGHVETTMTEENYLLTVELIFDRLTQQYNSDLSMQVIAPAPRSTPIVDALPAQFLITTKGKLGRTLKDNLRAIANARENMAVRVKPAFEISFETTAENQKLLATPDGQLTNAEHAQKLKVFRHRALMNVRQQDLTKGIELLLWYGGTLLPNRNSRDFHNDLERALRSWVSIYMQYGFAEYGGARDAWNDGLYPATPAVFTFSTHRPRRIAVGSDQGMLACGPVGDFPNAVLAISFVPNLISRWLRSQDQFDALSPDQRDWYFTLSAWQYGPH